MLEWSGTQNKTHCTLTILHLDKWSVVHMKFDCVPLFWWGWSGYKELNIAIEISCLLFTGVGAVNVNNWHPGCDHMN